MNRRRPPKRHTKQDLWLNRLRFATFRVRGPFSINSLGGGRGLIPPELASGELPEPDEELPDSDLSDNERQAAMQRERWRRDGRGKA